MEGTVATRHRVKLLFFFSFFFFSRERSESQVAFGGRDLTAREDGGFPLERSFTTFLPEGRGFKYRHPWYLPQGISGLASSMDRGFRKKEKHVSQLSSIRCRVQRYAYRRNSHVKHKILPFLDSRLNRKPGAGADRQSKTTSNDSCCRDLASISLL